MNLNPKLLAKRLINALGYDVGRLITKQPTGLPQLDVFTLAVEHYLDRNPADHFFFVQFGAHNGKEGDPLAPLIRRFHWRGLLVEPQPDMMTELRQTYAAEPQLIFEQAAMGDHDGTANLYRFAPDPATPVPLSMMATLSYDHLLCNGFGYRGKIQTLEVPMLTIRTLLQKHKIRHVDLLQLDCEGYDYQLLRQWFDTTPLRPAIIHFENGPRPTEFAQFCRRLAKDGYQMLDVGLDTVVYRHKTAEQAAAWRDKTLGFYDCKV